MKKLTFAILGVLLGFSAMGQERPQYDSLQLAKANAAPALFTYAPEYESRKAREREEFLAIKSRLDTMDIPDTRRFKMIRDLYRGKNSRLLQKYLYADTQFEEETIVDE